MEQGRVFRLGEEWGIPVVVTSFNPFGAGQGLSTERETGMARQTVCFNPFGAGQGLSTIN